MLNDQQLAWRIAQLADIPHVQILRIHSGIPVVLPERLTPALTQMLKQTRLQVTMVMHCNHANEIDKVHHKAWLPLREVGVTLLNQAVLLQGVNDTAQSLIDLSYALYACGALPYYIHMLDKVQGAQHFAVDTRVARQLMRDISHQLPGYLVPKMICEEAGAGSKSIISYS